MPRYQHEGVFQCSNEDCCWDWIDDVTHMMPFPAMDCTMDEIWCKECPNCKTRGIKGVIVSTEDLDFEENMRASIIEGKSDERTGR